MKARRARERRERVKERFINVSYIIGSLWLR